MTNASPDQQDLYKKAVSDVLKKLEGRDPSLHKLWEETRQLCLDDFDRLYKDLGVSFDELFFESQLEKPGKAMVKKLLKKNIAKMSEGAVVIDLKEDGLGVFLLLKSDGTALYATKDLALAAEKFKKYKITKSVYVVGSEQKLYFQQLFKTLEHMGFKHAKDCTHVPFELVNLEGGKISSREGDLISAEELIAMLKKEALEGVISRHADWTKEEQEEAAHQISMGALKYTFLTQDNNRSILFDKKKALDFEGDSGPYIQYAHARICSILRKEAADESKKRLLSQLLHPSEQNLVAAPADFPLVLEKAGSDLKPNQLTMFLYGLAKSFNEFYRDCPILKGEEKVKQSRLLLIFCVKEVLSSGLALLGIPAPEKM